MSKKATPILPSPNVELLPAVGPAFPTETEIYILPDGQVIVADLPAELATVITALGGASVERLPDSEQTHAALANDG